MSIMCGIWVSELEFQVLSIVTICVESFSLSVNAVRSVHEKRQDLSLSFIWLSRGWGGQRAFAAFCLMDRAEEAVGVTGWDSTCWRGKKPSERKEPMATDHLSLKKHLWVCQVRDLDSLPDRFCLIRSKTQC